MKKYLYKKAAVLVLLSLCLQSCGVLEDAYNGLCDVLGIDNRDYASETVISDMTDGELISYLADCAEVLAYNENGILCFTDRAQMTDAYADAVLDYLGSTYYKRYSADEEMFSRLHEHYPELSVNTLIPAGDYEDEVYRLFGGGAKVRRASTSKYTYLDRINAYLLIGRAGSTTTEAVVLRAQETENTYRLTVRFIRDTIAYDDDYLIIFRKRTEGEGDGAVSSGYIYSVTVSGTVTAVQTQGAD